MASQRKRGPSSSSFRIPAEWTFRDSRIAEGFDRHVRQQLPWYDLITGIVAHVARHYITQGALCYDIGASTGNVGQAIRATLQARKARLIALDSAAEMAAQYRGKPGELVIADALEYDFEPFEFATCFLCMMFMPPALRADWLARLTQKVKPGGAIVVVDKFEPQAGYVASVMMRLALAGKVSQGVPAGEIVAKELSLAGVQRPLRRSEIPERAVEIFRVGDFAGWIIEG